MYDEHSRRDQLLRSSSIWSRVAARFASWLAWAGVRRTPRLVELILRRTRIFDSDFYLRTNTDVRAVGIDPFLHYLQFGLEEGRNVTPDFDSIYYKRRYSEEIDRSLTTAEDFRRHGRHRGRFATARAEMKEFIRRSNVLSFLVSGDRNEGPAKMAVHAIPAFAIEKFFDARFYMDTYPDVATSGFDPIDHYLRIGTAEGRNPSRYFHTAYYLAENSDVAASGVNPLAHYASAGRYEDRYPCDLVRRLEHLLRSDLFNAKEYVAQYPDLPSGIDPLDHFLSWGLWEGRNPSHLFDSAYYCSKHSAAIPAHLPPVLHYVIEGKVAGFAPRRPVMPLSEAPGDSAWSALAPRAGAQSPIVDVIVPVYGNSPLTLACLHSVLRAPQRCAYELVVIDDCGPDAGLRTRLDELAARGLFTLLKNEQNLGFVASANRGLLLHPERHVVLLNSDAEVHNDWLDRLLSVAFSAPNVATVTPLSNNGTICSYPRTLANNHEQLEIPDAELDRVAAMQNDGVAVEVPTGVGFCMFVSRTCIDDIGVFDLERFGKGYGEENDFCRRAAKRGWRNLLATNVFVRHYGGASFGTEKAGREREAVAKVLALHSDYMERIAEHVRTDCARPSRVRLDIARLGRIASADGGSVLFVPGRQGGGVARHVRELQGMLRRQRVPSARLEWDQDTPGLCHLADSHFALLPNAAHFRLPEESAILAALLSTLRVRHIHIHHLAGAGAAAPGALAQLALDHGIPYDVTIHDYFMVCPRTNLVDDSARYCGEPGPAACARCIAAHGTDFGGVSIDQWREHFAGMLRAARKVFVPSEDVARRMHRYHPGLRVAVRAHPSEGGAMPAAMEDCEPNSGNRRVAVLGALLTHKGSSLLLRCARLAWREHAPINFVVVGYTDVDDQLRLLPNVTITGRYWDGDVANVLGAYRCNVAWFPAVWPETHSYTLSAALEAGLFPVTFDLGAPAERLRALSWGKLLPLEHLDDPEAVLAGLLSIDPAAMPPSPSSAPQGKYANLIRDYYDIEGPL